MIPPPLLLFRHQADILMPALAGKTDGPSSDETFPLIICFVDDGPSVYAIPRT